LKEFMRESRVGGCVGSSLKVIAVTCVSVVVATSYLSAATENQHDTLGRPSEPEIASRSAIDGAGNITLNGKNFFPIGLYGLNWRAPFKRQLRALRIIANAGFNTVLMEDISNDRFGELLDEAHLLGIHVIVGSSSYTENSYIAETVEKYKDKPAVLAWSLFDDADDGRVTPRQLAGRSALVKAIDPHHFTLSTLTGYYRDRREAKASWIAASDASAIQIYPVDPPVDYEIRFEDDDARPGNSPTQPHELARDYVAAAEGTGKAMLVSGQMFDWSDDKAVGSSYPSVAELRNMAYGQLMAGAAGIVNFTFSEGLARRKPRLWNEYVAIKNDVLGTFHSALTRGQVTRGRDNGKAPYSYWEVDGDLYVIAINPSLTRSESVRIKVPGQYYLNFVPTDERLAATLSFSGQIISGTIAPGGAQAYMISSAPFRSSGPPV
jgi:hypothetical protein